MTAEVGFAKTPVQSTQGTGALFTEQEFEFTHTDGATGSGSFLVCFVGVIESNVGSAQALEATFSGAVEQSMTLAHEVTGHGNAFPSLHIFTLTDPSFNTEGSISVRFDEPVSNVQAFSVVYTGVNTTSLGYSPGSFVSNVRPTPTSTGIISGSLSTANPGDLLVDCVVAMAGLPDDHTVGNDQILVDRLDLNQGESAAMSLSHKLAINIGDVGMVRTDVTSLETVTSTAFVIFMH